MTYDAYQDLLLCVQSKYPGETRHETARRYLIQQENCSHPPAPLLVIKWVLERVRSGKLDLAKVDPWDLLDELEVDLKISIPTASLNRRKGICRYEP